jgi:hypothetical protein
MSWRSVEPARQNPLIDDDVLRLIASLVAQPNPRWRWTRPACASRSARSGSDAAGSAANHVSSPDDQPDGVRHLAHFSEQIVAPMLIFVISKVIGSSPTCPPKRQREGGLPAPTVAPSIDRELRLVNQFSSANLQTLNRASRAIREWTAASVAPGVEVDCQRHVFHDFDFANQALGSAGSCTHQQTQRLTLQILCLAAEATPL